MTISLTIRKRKTILDQPSEDDFTGEEDSKDENIEEAGVALYSLN